MCNHVPHHDRSDAITLHPTLPGGSSGTLLPTICFSSRHANLGIDPESKIRQGVTFRFLSSNAWITSFMRYVLPDVFLLKDTAASESTHTTTLWDQLLVLHKCHLARSPFLPVESTLHSSAFLTFHPGSQLEQNSAILAHCISMLCTGCLAVRRSY